MPRSYAFVQVDVFTDRIFGGNQLAVFLEPDGLADDEMQAIAREMNLAETVFVFPATRADCAARLRIFTPGLELPFAGHPTVGTAWVLSAARRLPPETRTFAFEEGIGPVPVAIEGDLHAPSTVWMNHRDPTFGAPVEARAAIAAAIGVQDADLLPEVPVVSGSTGVEFLYVALRTPDAVDRAQPDMRALSAAYPNDRVGVFVFAPDPRQPGRVYSRMFAGDTIGVPEDAATGSASGPLGALVVEHQLVEASDASEIISWQGIKMGRPSTIRIRFRRVDGHARDIQVGGGTVPVLEGVLTLP